MMTPIKNIFNGRGKLIIFAFLFAVFLSAVYSGYRSNAPFVGDGGWRLAEEQYTLDRPVIGTNRHLLFKMHHFYFRNLLAMLGLVPGDRYDFFYQQTLLNSVSGGIAAAIFFLILFRLTRNLFSSCWGALSLALTNIFIIHSTHPSEPLPAFAMSLLSVFLLIHCIKRKSIISAALSGSFMAYAFCSYQAMLAYFPAMAAVFLYKILGGKEDRKTYAVSFFVFCLSLFGLIAVVYGAAYAHFQSLREPWQFWKEFTRDEYSKSWLRQGYSWSKFYALGEGLLRSVFRVENISIELDMLTGQKFSAGYDERTAYTALLQLMGACLIALAVRNKQTSVFSSIMTAAFACFIIPPLFVPAYYHSTYSKLWLQPLAALIALTAYHAGFFLRNPAKRLSKIAVYGLFSAFLLYLGTVNYNRVLKAHHEGDKRLLSISEEIRSLTEENSMILFRAPMLDLIFKIFYAEDRHLETLADHHHKSVSEVSQFIEKKHREAEERGLSLYWLVMVENSLAGAPPQKKYIYDLYSRYASEGKILKSFIAGNYRYSLLRIVRAKEKSSSSSERTGASPNSFSSPSAGGGPKAA